MKQNSFFYISLALAITLGLVISSYIFGWTIPTANPPSGNITLSQSPWQISGSDIYYNSGKVGIGTTTPQSALDVTGNMIIRTSTSTVTLKADQSISTGLNSDLLDGYHASDLLATGTYSSWDCVHISKTGSGTITASCPTGYRVITCGGYCNEQGLCWETVLHIYLIG